MTERQAKPVTPPHPFWCDDCGAKAGFTIRGCPIEHAKCCRRHGEDPEAVFSSAAKWCQQTGESIP